MVVAALGVLFLVIPMVTCPHCLTPSLVRSHRHWYDWPRYLLTKQLPYRCRVCGERYWLSAFSLPVAHNGPHE
jgi:hypothetical protein